MTTPNLPAMSDILDPAIEDQAWMQIDAYNANDRGQPTGAFAEILARFRATAEWRNGITRQIRDVGRYFRGTTMPTALAVAEFFGLPVFTTAGRPAAGNAGRLIFDSDLSTVLVDDGATWEEIGGSVALGDLPDGAACSVLGRAANSSGIRADIAAASDATFLGRVAGVLTFTTIDTSSISDQSLYDQNLAALANNTLTDGAEVIGSHTWTVANQATGADTLEVLNGSGIHYNASTANTQYTPTTRDATYIRIPITTLIPTWDCLRAYVIEVYCPTITLPGTNNRIMAALEGDQGGTDALLGGFFRYNGSVTTIGCQLGATITAGIDKGARDAFAVRVDHSGVFVAAGTYSGGNFPNYDLHGASNTLAAISGSHPLDPTSSFLTLAFVTGGVGGTMDVVVGRVRVRRLW